MSGFAFLALTLAILYVLAGLIIFFVGTRPASAIHPRRLIIRRSTRRAARRGVPFDAALYVRAEGSGAVQQESSRILLLIDHSSSMGSPSQPGSPLSLALYSARQFIHEVDFSRHRVGIAIFDHTSQTISPLTSSRQVIEQALRNVGGGGATNLFLGMQEAWTVLRIAREQRSTEIGKIREVIVALTDGGTDHEQELRDFCGQLRDVQGVRIIMVGLGSGVNGKLLNEISSLLAAEAELTSTAREFYHVPNPEKLPDLYRSLSRQVAPASGYGATVSERLNRSVFNFAAFSPEHPPLFSPAADTTSRTVVCWPLSVVRSQPTAIQYTVRPKRMGWYRLARDRATLSYYDSQGRLHVPPRHTGSAQGQDGIDDPKCLSNPDPWVLVLPRFGWLFMWTILLNPVFWILRDQIRALFRRSATAGASEEEAAVIPPVRPLPMPVLPEIPVVAIAKTPVRPTLVIAAGTAGRQVLTTYKCLMKDICGGEFPSDRVRLLAVDTDTRSLADEESFAATRLDDDELAVIPLDIYELHRQLLTDPPAHLQWYRAAELASLPREVFGGTQGVQRVRQVGRLALFHELDREHSTLVTRISEACSFLKEWAGKPDEESPQVVFVGSGVGGTGSAILNDLAYIVHGVLQLREDGGAGYHLSSWALALGPRCFPCHVEDLSVLQQNFRAFLSEANRLDVNGDYGWKIEYGKSLRELFGTSKSTDPDRATRRTTIYDRLLVYDPPEVLYGLHDQGIGRVPPQDGYFVAAADLLCHGTIQTPQLSDLWEGQIQQAVNNQRVDAQQMQVVHIASQGVRLPLSALREYCKWRLACDWVVGRTLWAEMGEQSYRVQSETTEGQINLDHLTQGGAPLPPQDPPVLFKELRELNEPAQASAVDLWRRVFDSIDDNGGADQTGVLVAKQMRGAGHRLLHWILFSLNGSFSSGSSGTDQEQANVTHLDGALPRTIHLLDEFGHLLDHAGVALDNMPISSVLPDSLDHFPQWKADLLFQLIDAYQQMASSFQRRLEAWHRGLLGLTAQSSDETPAVSLQIAQRLRSAHVSLGQVGRSCLIRFPADDHYCSSIYDAGLRRLLDSASWRRRLQWSVEANCLRRFTTTLESGAQGTNLDKLIEQLLVLRIASRSSSREYSDPWTQRDEIVQAIADVIDESDSPQAYYDRFAREAPSLVERYTPPGGLLDPISDPTAEQKLLIYSSDGLPPISVPAGATEITVYRAPLCRALVEIQYPVSMPVLIDALDAALGSHRDSRVLKPYHHVFREERLSRTVCYLLKEDGLGINYTEFSPRMRQLFSHLDQLQEFVYFALNDQIHPMMNAELQRHVLVLQADSKYFVLTRDNTSPLNALRTYVIEGRDAITDEAFPRQKIVPDQFLAAIVQAKEQGAERWNELPRPMPREMEYLIGLIEMAGGWLDLRRAATSRLSPVR